MNEYNVFYYDNNALRYILVFAPDEGTAIHNGMMMAKHNNPSKKLIYEKTEYIGTI